MGIKIITTVLLIIIIITCTILPPTTRSRQMSLGQSQDFTMEDLENFLNKESMSNIFNWLNDPKLSISGGVGGNIVGME